MIVKVTQENINSGNRGCDSICPVADAIWKSGDFWNVSVGEDEMFINDTKYRTPHIVADFIHSYDAGETVNPFEFVIADDAAR